MRLLERIEAQALERKAMEQMDMQNVANLLWGFASLRYQPTQLLPPLSAALANSGLCMSAKPVEVADLAFALSRLGQPGEHGPLLLALAGRASPSALSDFSSRQVTQPPAPTPTPTLTRTLSLTLNLALNLTLNLTPTLTSTLTP